MAGAGNRKKDWCFTIHSGHFGDKSEEQIINELLNVTCTYIVFQQETGGELGRDHLQGYVMFKTLKTLAGAKAMLPCDAHLEMRMADKISDAIKYCKKDDTRRPGCFFHEKGVAPMDHGVKRTLRDACELAKSHGAKRVAMDMPEEYVRYHAGLGKLANIAAEDNLPEWRDVKVIVVVGDSGCGKSWFAEHYDTRENTYPMSDTDPVWVDGYWGQRTIVIEEMDAQMPFRFLLRLLDGYRLNMPTKGGFIWGEHTTVLITSNTSPDRWYNDGFANTWSFDTTLMTAGPLQRRITSIHVGTGVYPNTTWDNPLPTRVPDEIHPLVPRVAEELRLEAPEVAPDSGAVPDDPIDIDVPGAVVIEPMTPITQGLMEGLLNLDVDDFLSFDD